MKDFFANLGSLYWWLSVVIVGVLINLTSSYIKSKLDSSLSRRSTKARLRSEARKTKRKKLLEKLRANSHEQTMMSISVLEDMVRAVAVILVSASLVLLIILINATPSDDLLWWPFGPDAAARIARIVKPVTAFLSIALLLISLSDLLRAMSKKALLGEARRENESEPKS